MQTVARVPRNSTEQISFRGNGTQPRVFRSAAGSLKVRRSARERERVVWRPWNRVATWPARATACSIASASVLPFPCHLYRASKPGFRFNVAIKLVATRDERRIRDRRKEERRTATKRVDGWDRATQFEFGGQAIFSRGETIKSVERDKGREWIAAG